MKKYLKNMVGMLLLVLKILCLIVSIKIFKISLDDCILFFDDDVFYCMCKCKFMIIIFFFLENIVMKKGICLLNY